ncbi:aryl hydrocarbon receptor nuclear translocator homolog [Hetaerina americana]|uniref:aryl hydrocarbon receptor nuclear translocator homolog n=1 Tax=Hetaerina americana TaxID=62018 RepID=UPI003A7F3AB2
MRSGAEDEDGEEDDGESSAGPPSSAAPRGSSSSAAEEDSPTSSAGSAAASSAAALVAKQMPSSSRVMRNLAEKMRRDKLNTYIGELATLVPMVSSSPRRLDKTSVLRLSATYLRMHRTLHPSDGTLRPFLPKALKAFNLSEKVPEDMDGFMVIVMGTGKIVFVSHTVEKLLGHTQNDLLGQSLFGITHVDDHKLLAKNLSLDAEAGNDAESSSTDDLGFMSNCCPGSSEDQDQPVEGHHHPMLQGGEAQDSGSSSSGSGSSDNNSNSRRVSFYLRLSQRAGGRETTGYEVVHFVGQLRPASSEDGPSSAVGKELSHTQSTSSGSSSGETVMVAVARIRRERQILELSLMEACKDEYLTRHGIRGEILNCDHRISVIAGYMADEVKGQSAFSFMHDQDARWTFIALQRMFSSSDGFGNSCYRLKSKTGQFIYLRTQGYCEFDRVTGKFDTFVCINTLVSEEEGKKAVEEMRQRYSASISDRSMVPRSILDAGPSRAIEAPTSKPISSPSPKQAIQGSPQDLPLLPVSLPSTSASLAQPSPHQALQHVVVSPEPQSKESLVYDATQEDIKVLTPKSYVSSTSPPPPIIPIPIPCAISSTPPPYMFDGTVPPVKASHSSLPYSSPKDVARGAERQISPREATWTPRSQGINPLKRSPSNSPPPAHPSKRLQHSTTPKVEPVVSSNSRVTVWPRLDCLSSVEPSRLGGALPTVNSALPLMASSDHTLEVTDISVGRELRGVDPQRPMRELTSECARMGKFPEDDRRLPGWVCDDVRPASLDLISLDRNSDFPDLRDDVEQLDIFSMQVGSELVDPRRWDLPGESQIQELDGSVELPDSIVGAEDPSVEETIHGGIRRSHRRLRLRLDSQGCTMASIERNLAGLTGSHIIEGDLARLRVERKKQMHMLHTLEQEHQSSIPTQDKTKAYGMQNVGV